MPLILIEDIFPDVKLGLWKMDESVEDLFILNPLLALQKVRVCNSYSSDQRRREVFTVHQLIYDMVGDDVELFHDESGCPYLSNGLNISISHTRGCAAVIVSSRFKVSVDVEYISERVNRITDKFLRMDEQAETLVDKLIHWCTKETLYKLYPNNHLAFMDMQLLSIEGNDNNGIITAKNLVCDKIQDVYYRSFDNFVLTYAVL